MTSTDSLRFASEEIDSAARRQDAPALRLALSLAFGVLLAADTVTPSMKTSIVTEFTTLNRLADRDLEMLAGSIKNELARAAQ